ncbi:MAG: RimK family alpha-L-glutamate ligase [Nitrospinota bacterium]|nr:RimK family alpha-L-glutamate ligase [Nitrospinota bacterium]
MHIVILCRDKKLYSVNRLSDTAHKRGHKTEILDPYQFLLNINKDSLSLKYSNEYFNGADIFLPRLGACKSDYSFNLLRHLEFSGYRVVNNTKSISIARDKIFTQQFLAFNGFPILKSSISPNPEFLKSALDNVGGVPVIMKLPRSSQGNGVMKISKINESQSIADVMWNIKQNIIIQEFISNEPNSDIRVLVVGNKVIGSVRRMVPKGEFRSNHNRGGIFKEFKMNDEIEALSIRVASVCGLEIAGIDFLETENGFVILEVNSAPGFKGIEEIQKNDIATRIIEHIESS